MLEQHDKREIRPKSGSEAAEPERVGPRTGMTGEGEDGKPGHELANEQFSEKLRADHPLEKEQVAGGAPDGVKPMEAAGAAGAGGEHEVKKGDEEVKIREAESGKDAAADAAKPGPRSDLRGDQE